MIESARFNYVHYGVHLLIVHTDEILMFVIHGHYSNGFIGEINIILGGLILVGSVRMDLDVLFLNLS